MALEEAPSGRWLMSLPVSINVPSQMQIFHTRTRIAVLRTVPMILFLSRPGDAMSATHIKVV